MKAIVVGGDYAFGKNREGNLDLLKRYAGDHGVRSDCRRLDKNIRNPSSKNQQYQNRGLIIDGKVEDASKLLGRHYQIRAVL
jgi:riboflavin kinase/FMN adenylyltransferase